MFFFVFFLVGPLSDLPAAEAGRDDDEFTLPIRVHVLCILHGMNHRLNAEYRLASDAHSATKLMWEGESAYCCFVRLFAYLLQCMVLTFMLVRETRLDVKGTSPCAGHL